MGLRIEGIEKAWRSFQLKDIDLEIRDGEYFILLGPTGAGKSLLLEVLAGFHKPDKGRIILNEQDITALPPEDRNVGYVPQKDALFPHLTVRQNIGFGLKMRGKPKDERDDAVDKTSKMLGLMHLQDRFPPTLSGGEKQKVALARTLVIEPKLVLLDEPLNSVDQGERQNLREELKRINRDLALTMIHVTHDQFEALSLARRMGAIREGKIIRVGDTREIFEDPRNPFLAKFLGYENIYGVNVKEKKEGLLELELDGQTLKAVAGVEDVAKMVGIHPNDVSISTTIPNSRENVLRGAIKDFSDLGQTVTVTVDMGLLIKVNVSRRDFLKLELESGKEVWLSFQADSVKILEE
jgi:molybdate/tungstate transport system ATP-binding protein